MEGEETLTAEQIAANIAHEELNRSVEAIIETVEGKRFIYWLLDRCAMYRDAFGGAGMADVTHHSLGRQSVGRMLVNKLDEINPRLFPRLLLEMATIRENDAAIAARQVGAAQPEDEDEQYA